MTCDPEMRKAVVNRLRREQDENGCVSNESVRQAAHRLSMSTRQVRRLVRGDGQPRKRFVLTEHHLDVLFAVGGAATEAYKDLAGTEHDPKVGLRVFQRAVADLDPALRATAREGWRGAIDRFVYAAKEAGYRGHTYCVDHTPAPVPVVSHRGNTEWFYPWVTIVWDEATRLALAGDAVAHDPQAETTRDVVITALEGFDLDDGTRAGGMPEWLLSDRGSDLVGEINGLGLVRAGVGRKFSPPRESYQNGIAEKNLGLLQDEWCRRLPGFQPGKRDSHPVQIVAAQLLTLDQFRALLATELHRWNELRPHGSLAGLTPAQAWAADEQVVPAADPAALRLAMLKSDKTPQVGKNGIRFDGEDYIHPSKLRQYFGKTVEIRYLPRRPEFVEVFYNGQHVCRATLRKAQSDVDKGEMLADRKALKAAFSAHALEGARIAAHAQNDKLREMQFPEDELPAVPAAAGAKVPAAKGASAGPAVTDDDLDRLDALISGTGTASTTSPAEQDGTAATGTDG